MLEIATTFAKYKRWEAAEHLEGKRIPQKNGPISPTIGGSPIFMWGNGGIHGYSYPQSGWKGILFLTHTHWSESSLLSYCALATPSGARGARQNHRSSACASHAGTATFCFCSLVISLKRRGKHVGKRN